MNLSLFLAGGIGALVPEIVRLYEIRERRRIIRFSKFYLFVSAMYVLLGGYVGMVFPTSGSEFLAFAVGVGLVAVVNTSAKLAGRVTRRYLYKQHEGEGVESLGGKGGLRDPSEFRKEET